MQISQLSYFGEITLPSPSALPPSPIAGRYRVERELARGGSGVVFAVVDESTERRVALKRLLAGEGRNAAIARLFEREYYTLKHLCHPRIIEVYDYGTDERGPFYTMELLDGSDLRDLAPLSFGEACRHLRDVASSLALLHARRLLHRDVSPRNVRLSGDGRAKLIDFGSLASFGLPSEVIGTPPCIPPEAVRGAPLDHRSDLYGLGALAYWLLTRRHAYPAQTIAQLANAWRTPPLPPSALVSCVPDALDKLVLALLSLDPTARPASAAHVIDELSAIAELEGQDSAGAAQSYFLNGRLVGRTSELERLRGRLFRAAQGQGGSAICIEALGGMGRTRLSSELLLQAELLGLGVLMVQAEASSGAYGVVRALLASARERIPKMRAILERRRDLLSHITPELDAAGAAPSTSSTDPIELRTMLGTTVRGAFTEMAAETALLIVVEDIHAVDEISASVLTALAREAPKHRLMFVTTRRAGVDMSESARSVCSASARMTLRGLSAADVGLLTGSIFGDAENSGRLGRWLHEQTGGNPGDCIELARQLVDDGVIRYVEGAWVLPQEIGDSVVRRSAEHNVDRRLLALDQDVRGLAETLSVRRHPWTLDLCLQLDRMRDRARLFVALERLVAEGILIAQRDTYRFADPRVRDHIAGSILPARRAEIHRSIGEKLAERAQDDPSVSLEAGLHLLDSGQRSRGADLVMSSVVLLFRKGQYTRTAASALEVAREVYEAEKRSLVELATVYSALAAAGYYVDRRLAYKYSDRALAFCTEATGIAPCARYEAASGRHLGVSESILAAAMRHEALRVGRGAQESPIISFSDLFAAFFSAALCTGGVGACCMDADLAKKAVAALEPVRELGDDHAASLMYRECARMLDSCRGRDWEVYQACLDALDRLNRPGQAPEIEALKGGLKGGNLFALGIRAALMDGTEALRYAAELDELGGGIHRTIADQIRMLYHAYRAEAALALQYRDAVELSAIEGGTTWQVEVFLPVTLSNAYALTGDIVGLKRSVEQLSRAAEDTPALEIHRDFTRALYHAERGDTGRALEIYERLAPIVQPGERAGWHQVLVGYASALNQARRHEEALAVIETLQSLAPLSQFGVFHVLYATEVAIAQAGMGQPEHAMAMLDGLLAQHTHSENPLFIGLLHEARARVSLEARNDQAFERHLESARSYFQKTENRAIVARTERLAREAARRGLSASVPAEWAEGSTANRSALIETVRGQLSECRGADERAERALGILVEQSGAARGYLFTVDPVGLQFVVSTGSDDPPVSLVVEVQEALKPFIDADETTGDVSEGDPTTRFESAHRKLLVLSVAHEGRLVVVGAVILEAGDVPLNAPPSEIASAIAKNLYDEGDVEIARG